jgi:integrase
VSLSDIGADFVLVDMPVDLYPKIEVVIDSETGELAPKVKSSKRKNRTLRLLLDKEGKALYPHNLFLHSLMAERGLKNTNTHASALLAYNRWLDATNLTYRSLTGEPHEGTPWLFADYLLDDLRVINPETGESDNEDGFALSTARTYMRCIIDFYKWLHREGVLTWSKDCKPFEFIYVRTKKNQNRDIYMLSHIHKNKTIEVQTTTLMKRFPKIQSTPQHKKLKPLTANHKAELEAVLDELDGVKVLMTRLMLKTGLRLDELVSFPDDVVKTPVLDVTKVSIGPANSVRTKYSKQREIEVPWGIMQELYEYKASDERQAALEKAGISIDNDLNQRLHDGGGNTHGRLFVSRKGEPFSANTFQTFFSGIRKRIRKKDPTWYYRVHDLRSTFATYWLIEEQKKRDVLFDFLQGELAVLLGHEDESTTKKYINFMNSHVVLTKHSARKNKQAEEVMR